MKYQIGDLVLVKDCEYKPHLHLRLRPRPVLFDSYGIITKAINHSDAWEGETTSNDNIYVWFSQVDCKEYFFFQDEVTGEVIK
jgi:hypothetical protein